MKLPKVSIDVLWLAMPVFVVTIRSLLQPIPMEDYWWHLVMGRLIDAHGVPETNLFLFTLPGDTPFYDQPWLAQLLMFHIADGIGHVATVFAHCALLLCAWIPLVALGLRRGATPVAVGIAASLAYYVSASTLMPRTQMFAYPLFVLLVGLLLWLAGPQRRGRGVAVAVLLAITAFWANVHGSYILASVLTGGVALGWTLDERRAGRRPAPRAIGGWSLVVLAVLGATAVSPGGLQNLIYPFKILFATKGHSATVLEWAPASPLSPPGALFYLALAASVVVLWRRRRDVRFVELAIVAPTALIALTSVRGVLWWSLAAVIVVVPHFCALRAPAPREEPGPRESAVNIGLLGTLALLVLLAFPGMPLFRAVDPSAIFSEGRLGDEGAASVLSSMIPAVVLEEHRDLLRDRRIFHHQAVGGLLEWRLTTATDARPVAFIDQRLELVPQELWDAYFDVSRTEGDWEGIIERWDIDAFLVELDEQERLVEWLERSPAHELVVEDRMWRLYLRR